MLPASQHCLPNPLKLYVCSIEISPPTAAAAHFLPLPAPHFSVCGWLMVVFISAHFLPPIRTCHLLVDLGQTRSSFLLSNLKEKRRHGAEMDNCTSDVKGNNFLIPSDWFRAEVFINSVKVETDLLQPLWNLPNRVIWQLRHLIELATDMY